MIHHPELDWFKSSYSSSSDGNDCVEVAWFKSSYSDSSDINDCIEVANTPVRFWSGTPRTSSVPT